MGARGVVCVGPILLREGALPVLLENVSVEGASASFLLWYLRKHCCLSNFVICLLWTEVFEVVSLLVNRYNLVE